jgi:hypothetical protein
MRWPDEDVPLPAAKGFNLTTKLLRLTRRLTPLAAVILMAAVNACAAQTPCEEFSRMLKATYNFKPSLLKDDAERSAKSAAMDRFWETVKSRQKEMLPCLRVALEDSKSDSWFGFDGSALLVSLDPSQESKAVQVRRHASVDLDDVDLSVWVTTLAHLGAEGLDIAEPSARWLAYKRAEYYLPLHGDYHVTNK